MSMQKKINNKRLLDALDQVDERYVAELVQGLKLPKEEAEVITGKKSFTRSIKYAVAVAACALLLGAAIPVANRLLSGISDGAGTSPTAGISDLSASYTATAETEKEPELLEQEGQAFEGSPLFRIVNTDKYEKPFCEVFNADGESIDLCVCGNTPCTCYVDRYYITVCGNTVYYLLQDSDMITVAAYDVSDPDNIKYATRKFSFFGSSTHDVYAMNGTSFFYAYGKDEGLEKNPGLTVINLAYLLVEGEGGVYVHSYDDYGYLKDSATILHIESTYNKMEIYLGMKDENTNAVTRIAKLHTVLGDKDSALIEDRKSKQVCEVLFDVDNHYFFGIRSHLTVAGDGTICYIREESDSLSRYGYSLYQYTWREGEGVTKALRATDICDFIVCDGYIYYAVNDPAYSREFTNYDVNEIYTDMTGGIIYRLPAESLNYAPMIAWELGDEYYLYGTTDKNPPSSGKHNALPIFIQGADGGIALWANKQVGDNFVHLNLLIGEGKNGTVMTELLGCYWWGYWGLSDVGGGTNVNWEYRP